MLLEDAQILSKVILQKKSIRSKIDGTKFFLLFIIVLVSSSLD